MRADIVAGAIFPDYELDRSCRQNVARFSETTGVRIR